MVLFVFFFFNFEQTKLIGIKSLTFVCKNNALVKGENGKFLCEDYKINNWMTIIGHFLFAFRYVIMRALSIFL